MPNPNQIFRFRNVSDTSLDNAPRTSVDFAGDFHKSIRSAAIAFDMEKPKGYVLVTFPWEALVYCLLDRERNEIGRVQLLAVDHDPVVGSEILLSEIDDKCNVKIEKPLDALKEVSISPVEKIFNKNTIEQDEADDDSSDRPSPYKLIKGKTTKEFEAELAAYCTGNKPYTYDGDYQHTALWVESLNKIVHYYSAVVKRSQSETEPVNRDRISAVELMTSRILNELSYVCGGRLCVDVQDVDPESESYGKVFKLFWDSTVGIATLFNVLKDSDCKMPEFSRLQPVAMFEGNTAFYGMNHKDQVVAQMRVIGNSSQMTKLAKFMTEK